MKVSVLVPVYGVEKYVERCAVSLFEQTHPDMEYVFVNDHTPDRSMAILRSVIDRYPSRREQVVIVENAVNLGVGAARAIALASATGDCVMHADSDDFLPPRAVELLCREMEVSGADMVDGAWQLATPKGLSSPVLPYRGGDETAYLRLALCQNVVSNRLWGRLFKRSLHADNGVDIKPGIDYCEDYSVMTRLLLGARRSFIDDVVYYYSDENAASYTHTMSPRHVRSYLKSNALVLDFFTRRDASGRFLTPLRIGLVNAERSVRLNGFSREEARRLLPYEPRGLVFRLLHAMFRGKCPYKVAEIAYLVVRRCYVRWIDRTVSDVRKNNCNGLVG